MPIVLTTTSRPHCQRSDSDEINEHQLLVLKQKSQAWLAPAVRIPKPNLSPVITRQNCEPQTVRRPLAYTTSCVGLLNGLFSPVEIMFPTGAGRLQQLKIGTLELPWVTTNQPYPRSHWLCRQPAHISPSLMLIDVPVQNETETLMTYIFLSRKY